MSNQSGFSIAKGLIVVAALGAAGFLGYRYFRKPASAPVQYRTEEIKRGDLVQSVTANGSLVPVRLVEVGSQISGVITELKADFNSRVKEGDIIAQIDPATYERAVLQAEAELANAEAARELSRLEYDRSRELFEGSLISKAENDQARVNLLQAEATVKTRQANVERAKVDLSRTTIYAPMDGIIISRQVESGQTVAASMNAPTLFVLANDLTKMRIEAAVSEADIGGVEEGQPVQFDVDAFPGRRFPGVVEQVRFAPTTNQNVVTYTTVVAVDNKEMKLRPGMTANARIITSERHGVLKLPNAALRFRPPEAAMPQGDPASPPPPAPAVGPAAATPTEPGGLSPSGEPGGPAPATVHVVEPGTPATGTKAPVLRSVTVTLGVSDGSTTELLDGLKEGDVVATGIMAGGPGETNLRNPFSPFPPRPRR
ncbi:MAG: efflux RND transporter periplasmic adaptor subunit [Verrucomicrobiales bacterium]|nr:efflux RND transporter periplasmic adaptor subunit [Verrucomicrobiales bacterium]